MGFKSDVGVGVGLKPENQKKQISKICGRRVVHVAANEGTLDIIFALRRIKISTPFYHQEAVTCIGYFRRGRGRHLFSHSLVHKLNLYCIPKRQHGALRVASLGSRSHGWFAGRGL